MRSDTCRTKPFSQEQWLLRFLCSQSRTVRISQLSHLSFGSTRFFIQPRYALPSPYVGVKFLIKTRNAKHGFPMQPISYDQSIAPIDLRSNSNGYTLSRPFSSEKKRFSHFFPRRSLARSLIIVGRSFRRRVFFLSAAGCLDLIHSISKKQFRPAHALQPEPNLVLWNGDAICCYSTKTFSKQSNLLIRAN